MSLVCRTAVLALLAAAIAPAAANQIVIAPTATNEIVGEPLPAAGETVLISAQPFLDKVEARPDFIEALVERVRDLKRYMRRQIAQIEVALGEEEVPSLATGVALDPEDARRDAEMRVTDALDPEATVLATMDARVVTRSNSIGLHDSAQLAYDAPENASAGLTRADRGGVANLVPGSETASMPAERPRLSLVAFFFDVLRWIRSEPLVTMLVLSGIVFLAWARHAGARQS